MLVTEKDILNAIESIRRRRLPQPVRGLELTKDQFEALQKLPIKSIPMEETNRILTVPVFVKDKLISENLVGDEYRPVYIDEEYNLFE